MSGADLHCYVVGIERNRGKRRRVTINFKNNDQPNKFQLGHVGLCLTGLDIKTNHLFLCSSQ